MGFWEQQPEPVLYRECFTTGHVSAETPPYVHSTRQRNKSRWFSSTRGPAGPGSQQLIPS